MKKQSAYQKLKARNAQLQNDIYEIVMKQNPAVTMRYRMHFKVEEAVWQGSVDDKVAGFGGLLNESNAK